MVKEGRRMRGDEKDARGRKVKFSNGRSLEGKRSIHYRLLGGYLMQKEGNPDTDQATGPESEPEPVAGVVIG